MGVCFPQSRRRSTCRYRVIMTIPDELKQTLPESLLSGSAESFGMRITALTLQDGSQIALPKSGVLAVVGPNNAGKSTLLREIVEHLRLGPSQHGIFRHIYR